jgi:Xaa-Pro dipeptidase
MASSAFVWKIAFTSRKAARACSPDRARQSISPLDKPMPQQTNQVPAETYHARIAKLQEAMKEFGLRAIVLESGPAMMYLTGVRWGRSERTFAVVFTQTGDPAWVLPGFEEMRARELIQVGEDIRVWQEDESPYQRIAGILKDRGVALGRVGLEDSVRFFVFDGVRQASRQTPKLDYVSAQPALKAAGVDLTPAPARGGRKQ